MKIQYRREGGPYRNISIRVLCVILLLMVLLFTGCPPYEGTGEYTDTNGYARGVDTQGFYAYVADGIRGLKVMNISNPMGPYQVGAIDLDGFNGRVAVYGRLAAVTDTDQNRIFIVDIQDHFNPQLMWTYSTLDKPVNLYFKDNVIYIAERGENPQDGSYFSGIETVSCQYPNPPQQLSSVSISDITDVIARNSVVITYNNVYAVSKTKLTILSHSQGIINPPPVSTLSFAGTEQIQSIDFCTGDHLMVLGQSLYLLDISNISAPVIVTSVPVSGYPDERVISYHSVTYSIGPWGAPFSSFRYTESRFYYSTLREIGWGRINWSNQVLDLEGQMDVYHESDGHVKVYDIKALYHGHSLTLPYTRGAIFIGMVAALDNYGLGYERLAEIPFSQYNP